MLRELGYACVSAWMLVLGGCDRPPSTAYEPDLGDGAGLITFEEVRREQDGALHVRLDVAGKPWWLGTTAGGFPAYADSAFNPSVPQIRVERPPAAKIAQASDLLGDVDQSGQVNGNDAVFLFAWLATGLEMPSYDFALGDIDQDGRTDWQDLALLGAYVFTTPRPRTNPYKIGQALTLPLSGRLEPDPTTVDWSQQGVWHRFTVKLDGGRGNEQVRIQVNVDERKERTLAISSFRRQAGTGCVTWYEANVFKRHDDTVYIASCGYGASDIFLSHWTEGASTDERGNEQWGWALLGFYEIETVAPPPPPPPEPEEFNIELVFVNDRAYDHREKQQVRLAAERWERIITEGLPDVENSIYPSNLKTVWGTTITVRDRIDDIRIYVGTWHDPNVRTWGRAGQSWYRGSSYLPYLCSIAFNTARWDDLERANRFYLSSLHEIAHCMGFSAGYWEPERLNLIRNPSREKNGADAHFSGPNALAAFNRLGGMNYRGAKVPLENNPDAGYSRDSHWRESVFQNEVMDPYGDIGEYLSEITIAAFEDMGYQVDYSHADRYRLPRQASKPVAEALPHGWCEVIGKPVILSAD